MQYRPPSEQEMHNEQLEEIEFKPGKAPPMTKLPDAPKRDQFPTQEEFEEALGGWQSRVGRIKGLAGVKKSDV